MGTPKTLKELVKKIRDSGHSEAQIEGMIREFLAHQVMQKSLQDSEHEELLLAFFNQMVKPTGHAS